MRKDKFLDQIAFEPMSGCWIWMGPTGKKTGYGWFCINGKSMSAHRYSYRRFKGRLRKGMFVCHKCDVRECVNPDHLFLGTPKDNMRDASRKNRMTHGEKFHTAKLTVEQVKEIKRRLPLQSGLSLAREFGVHHSIIYDIKSGLTWWRVKPDEVGLPKCPNPECDNQDQELEVK